MIAILLAALAAAAPVVAAPIPAAQALRLKLRPGAEGKLCLECHAPFKAKLKQAFVHAPVRGNNCTGCHNPHASEHGKLLGADKEKLCLTCHEDVLPEKAKSMHQPFVAGNCTGCHDPHASDNKFELLKPGAQVCNSCHAAITTAAGQAKHKHLEKGQVACTTCHDAHASAKGEHLLKGDDPALCLGCHQPDKAFATAHMSYPVQKARCTTCHDPHGSNKKAMLYETLHKPVANKQCKDCHADPTSARPFETKAVGAALCSGCHAAEMARMLDKPQVHWAVTDEKACLNCHSAHGSRQRGLIKGNMKAVCATCHSDTIARQDRSVTKHKPVEDGDCTACHSPHSSETALLMKKADTTVMCRTCHDWQKHASHPLGAALKDPRNKNLVLDCLSCHRAHGTEYKHMNPYPTTTELCTKCHESFKR